MMRFWAATATTAAVGILAGLVTGFRLLPKAGAQDTWPAVSLPLSQLAKGNGRLAKGSGRRAEAREVADEGQALAHYQAAIAVSEKVAKTSAPVLGNSPDLASLEDEKALWRFAIQQLDRIPAHTMLHDRAIAKQSDYQARLRATDQKIGETRQRLIDEIVQSAGLDPGQVHLTLCQMSDRGGQPLGETVPFRDRCQSHQGDIPPASAASLIKVPIALALMEKVRDDNLSLGQDLFLDPDNFTENVATASLEVNNTYSLQQVMAEMIQTSDNIATNQLIDYLDYDFLNKTLRSLGYRNTTIGHKLMGADTMPANFGAGRNQTTTQDITTMLVNLYSLQTPGDEQIVAALAQQKDQALGYAALAGLSPQVKWMGEKTGQNRWVIATTLVMEIEGANYALTVFVNQGDALDGLRYIIQQLASQLAGEPLFTSKAPTS